MTYMKHTLLSVLMIAGCAVTAAAQTSASDSTPAPRRASVMRPQIQRKQSAPQLKLQPYAADAPELLAESVSDSLLRVYGSQPGYDPFDEPMSLPPDFFMPIVYDTYRYYNPLTISDNVYSGKPYMRWLEDYEVLARQISDLRYAVISRHPEKVKYNLSQLPTAPKQFVTVVNPADFSITISEGVAAPPVTAPTIRGEIVKKRHWINTFNAMLQFSQAYVSPNWYQGGNNNLNALGNVYYNVKLNQEYHPRLLFETTAQYKIGINNAPDDKVHNYNVSEDIFQINSTFGLKAARRWYYSVSAQFKTQMVQSFKSNSEELKSAFLSPGEATVGVGMTYNYANKPKTVTFDASMAPFSYNMVTVINDKVDAAMYNIEEGRQVKYSFGSSAELKFFWKLSYNIRFNSRMFVFTDYNAFQADWENTLAMDINKFLSTQIYVHARYDSRTPRVADTNWHKLQVKEIFSIGFFYKFSSI